MVPTNRRPNFPLGLLLLTTAVSACACVLLGSHTTSRLAKYNGMSLNFFSSSLIILATGNRLILLAIIHAAGIFIDIVLVASHSIFTPPASSSTSYALGRSYCTTSHCLCSSESCANYVTKLVGLRATSHSRSSLSPVSSLTSDSSRLVMSADPLFLTHAERFHPHKNSITGDHLGDECDAGCLHWVS